MIRCVQVCADSGDHTRLSVVVLCMMVSFEEIIGYVESGSDFGRVLRVAAPNSA